MKRFPELTINASYDVNISKLVAASQYRGGFEFTLTYKDLLNSRRRGKGGYPILAIYFPGAVTRRE